MGGCLSESEHPRAILRRLSQGSWKIDVRHEQLDHLTDELDRSSNRVSFAMVIAAIIIGSSVVITSDPQVSLLGVRLQWLGAIGYLVAGVLGVGLLWAILRSGRLS